MFERHKEHCWWKAIYGKHHLKTLKVVGQVNSHWTLQGLKIIIESSHTRWSTVVAEQSRCQSTRSWFWWPERATQLTKKIKGRQKRRRRRDWQQEKGRTRKQPEKSSHVVTSNTAHVHPEIVSTSVMRVISLTMIKHKELLQATARVGLGKAKNQCC